MFGFEWLGCLVVVFWFDVCLGLDDWIDGWGGLLVGLELVVSLLEIGELVGGWCFWLCVVVWFVCGGLFCFGLIVLVDLC